jgi:hypothetical protein
MDYADHTGFLRRAAVKIIQNPNEASLIETNKCSPSVQVGLYYFLITHFTLKYRRALDGRVVRPFYRSWRLELGIVAFTAIFMLLSPGKASSSGDPSTIQEPPVPGQPLPRLFWIYWVAIVLAVSVEFCMIFWSADYLEHVRGW